MHQERETKRDIDSGRKTAGQDRQGRSGTGRNVQCMTASEVCDCMSMMIRSLGVAVGLT